MASSMIQKKTSKLEALFIESYERISVKFPCGCKFYNDAWRSNTDVIRKCPVHQVSDGSLSGELITGSRPTDNCLTRAKATPQNHTADVIRDE